MGYYGNISIIVIQFSHINSELQKTFNCFTSNESLLLSNSFSNSNSMNSNYGIKRNNNISNDIVYRQKPYSLSNVNSNSSSPLNYKKNFTTDSGINSEIHISTQSSPTKEHLFKNLSSKDAKKDYLNFSNDPKNLIEIEMRLEKISCEIYEIKNL